MEDYYLKIDKEFWTGRGRKTIFPIGTKFLVETEKMGNQLGEIFINYYVYLKPGVSLGHFDEEEFNETFMTLNEFRDKKIDDII